MEKIKEMEKEIEKGITVPIVINGKEVSIHGTIHENETHSPTRYLDHSGKNRRSAKPL